MSWWWRCEDSGGAEVASEVASERFPTRADAETWLGEEWRGLLDSGVAAVCLLEDERVVYGPMRLDAG
ncbi:MAG: hypothetical protein ACYCO3_00690 [Mycobacteriales bacterium]